MARNCRCRQPSDCWRHRLTRDANAFADVMALIVLVMQPYLRHVPRTELVAVRWARGGGSAPSFMSLVLMKRPAKPPTIVHDHDAILDAWKRGERSGELAVRFGTSSGYIRTIIKNARERGDPRAELRGAAVAPAGRDLDHDAILDRWQAGWRAKEIAKFACTTPETIYDLLMNYRRRGDSRAIRRRLPNPRVG